MPAEQANRETLLSRLEQERWDLLVIGGGIVGAGVLYAAVREGLRAALVEQHDFAFGTSSRSSRLLHGGLRYLAQGRGAIGFRSQPGEAPSCPSSVAPRGTPAVSLPRLTGEVLGRCGSSGWGEAL